MKISKEEYENSLMKLTLKQYHSICIMISLIFFISGFLANYLYDKEFVYDFIISLVIAIVFYFVFKSSLNKTAKKIILNNDIKYIEQEISEDSITQKIIKNNDEQLTNRYLLSNLIKIKEDENNFYLYVTKNEMIIVIKQKIENIDVFRNIIKEKCHNCIKGVEK